jgi:hypothetical protein
VEGVKGANAIPSGLYRSGTEKYDFLGNFYYVCAFVFRFLLHPNTPQGNYHHGGKSKIDQIYFYHRRRSFFTRKGHYIGIAGAFAQRARVVGNDNEV